MREAALLLCAIGLALGLPLVAVPGGAGAQAFDGNYTGTIACGVLSDLRRPLSVDFSMKVTGNEATYEREIVRPGGGTGTIRTGNYERGKGTVSPSGEVVLRGQGEGSFRLEGEYRGQLTGSPIHLAGTQRWQVRGSTEERSCQIELTRRSSR